MEKQIIGRFYAESFDGKIIEFIVYDDNTMDCPSLNVYSFRRMFIKPRFCLIGENSYYDYDVPAVHYGESKLIANYVIDEDLFAYLKEANMIRYSTDMAYLYGFSDKAGYDSDPRYYGVGSPFKWAKKKGPILEKQRKGQFN